MAQRNCDFLSLRVKYQWPDDGLTKFEISPSTATCEKCASRSDLAIWFKLLTLSTFGGSATGAGVVSGKITALPPNRLDAVA